MNARNTAKNPAAAAWLAFGGLVALGLVWLVIKEFPAVRREWHLMSM